MMRFAPLLVLALWQAAVPSANPRYFHFERPVTLATGSEATACALLPADVFAHAAPSLADLRLYSGSVEIPYAVTLSEASAADERAGVLNLGTRAGQIVFDLEMPARRYTDVTLDLAASDFLATAKVSGSDALTGPTTALGEFTLFDLSAQRLSRSTTLHLQESSFRYLHVELAISPATGRQAARFEPSLVYGAQVPPSREAQTLYAPVSEAKPHLDAAERQTVAVFTVLARVPLERVAFVLDPQFKGNFSRAVRISARGNGAADALNEEVGGEISRVDIAREGRAVHQLQLTVPATLGVNMQRAATVSVAIEDGDDRPLPIVAIRLEMRERKLCFDAPSQPLTLFYGDPVLRAPIYDYARLFRPGPGLGEAHLEAEERNPSFTPRPDTRPYTDRHPEVLWVVLLGVIGVLAVVAFRSAHRRLPSHNRL